MSHDISFIKQRLTTGHTHTHTHISCHISTFVKSVRNSELNN